MRALRRAAVSSYIIIAATALLIAPEWLTPPPASASPATTTSADLVATINPTFQEKAGPSGEFTFTAVVTNNGPNPARQATVSVSGANPVLHPKVGFSVSPKGNCTTSGDTFTCYPLRVHASVTVGIEIDGFCFGHICSGTITVSAFSVTPDPNSTNNSAPGEWEIMCPRNCT